MRQDGTNRTQLAFGSVPLKLRTPTRIYIKLVSGDTGRVGFNLSLDQCFKKWDLLNKNLRKGDAKKYLDRTPKYE